MKGSCLSLNKIYGETSVPSLKARINFIASKRKKKWLSIEANLQLTHPHRHSPAESHHAPTAPAAGGRALCHSKVKSMELQDLKTRRYQQCRQDSERIMVSVALPSENWKSGGQWTFRASSCVG